MQLAAAPDPFHDMKSRPRPFGSGRLSSWQLLQAVEPAHRLAAAPSQPGSALISDGLDPVIAHDAQGELTMAFGAIARFQIAFDDQIVRLLAVHPDADQDTIDHLVDDHIAPRIIAATGELVLHGSAALIGKRIAVVMGQTGSGKSTLAASLHADGHRLLGDDAVVISAAGDGTFEGASVYPSLRLYRESIEQVFAETVGTSAMAFYSDKRHVAAAGLGAAPAERFALGAIYVLIEGEVGVTLQQMSPADACMSLVQNSFALDPHDPAAAAQRMAQAARVAAMIPCYELAYPYDFGLLGEARAQVVASLAAQEPTLSNPA